MYVFITVRVVFNEAVMSLIRQPGAHHFSEALYGLRCALCCVPVIGPVNDREQ